ncbi:hypothetical protein P389DRAFT_192855 [Cystobasidium minutum MCA 4210]|uniref:uncharacterized protein n=1 Tax=Cystobasidium minutum MCA 4210 TaxID=1397322 RepID=UPI0034CF3149|eukprot:jgi/Rhomi1/192855/gm1.1069_g
MFKSLSSSTSTRKLQAQLESLTFSRDLTSYADVTFNTTPYPNGADVIGYDGEISCMAYDAVQSLLAVSTKSGRITLYADFGRLPRLSWNLKPAIAIHHLLLKVGTSYLIAVDAKETLHLFDYADLDARGEPKRLLSHSMRSRVNCIENTPSLSHIFIACQDGCVDTFDVERGTISPYRIKNLWIEQDELLRRSGVPNAPSKKRIPACVEAKSHPLDPNQILIAYEGGIVLYDITQRHNIRTYEYIVLPGAPGGHDDQTEGAFLERRPMCTCLAWRADGRMFAAGYDDGSFALWSIEDGDKPVMARTISKEDVNLATSSNLFGDDGPTPSDIPGTFREPIYKLAWCGFSDAQGSHKGTILVVQGGTMPSDTKGLHCLHLPAFVAPSIINASNPKLLLEAYKASVRPNYTSILPTDTPPEDFVLLTSNPYYGQTFDPYSVLIMLSHDPELPEIAPHTQRGFVAFPFPPSMGMDPLALHLPLDLSLTGSKSAVWAEATTLPGSTCRRLYGDHAPADRLPLTGGEAKLVVAAQLAAHHKTQEKHHAVLTVSLDMTVDIWDYTNLMPKLLNSFSARDGLSDDQLMQYIDGQMLVTHASAAWDTTEMAFGLSTGDVLFYKFQYARPEAVRHKHEHEELQYRTDSPFGHFRHGSGSNTPQHDYGLAAATSRMGISTPSPKPYQHQQEPAPPSRRLFGRKKDRKPRQEGRSSSVQTSSFEINLQDSSHLSDWSKDGFKPMFGLSLEEDRSRGKSQITALSLSEAGFLAVAWGTKLAILDLRGPEVLFSESEGRQDGNINMLTWTICSEGSDTERHPRLLAAYESGITRIHTLSYVLDTWIVDQQIHTLRHEESGDIVAHMLLDSQGNVLSMDTGSLDDCLRASGHESPAPAHHHPDKAYLETISIIVGSKALTVFGNLSGERLLKRDFGTSTAVAARIVQKYAMPVLMVILSDGQCAIFSLPNCDVVRTMQIPYGRSWPSISPDGRVFQTLSPSFFNYFTIFPDQLPVPIEAKYYIPERPLPAAPGSSAVTTAGAAAVTYITSWFGSETAKNWEPVNLDDIMGGPNRPPPRPSKQVIETQKQANSQASSSTRPTSRLQDLGQRPPKDRVKQVEIEYNAFGIAKKRHELTDALEERGERLDFLNQHLDNASQASQDFLSQARRTAMLQSAKGAAAGVGKGAMYSINKMLS